jgi:hypothetical protein
MVATLNCLGTVTVYDPLDSHEWIGETWGSGTTVQYTDFEGRRCLKATVTRSVEDWAAIRTKRFPLQDWEASFTALKMDVYLTDAPVDTRLKIEFHGADYDPAVGGIIASSLAQDQWTTLNWPLAFVNDLSAVGALSIVLDRISGSKPTLYVDNLRLVDAQGQETAWDRMDGARQWFYFGNWYNWAGIEGFPGIEPIAAMQGAPGSPTAGLFLQWDIENGQGPGTSAEIGTNGGHSETNPEWLDEDLSQVDRFGARIRSSSTDVAFRVFFYDADTDTGFATASAFPQNADTWQQVVWDIPWPHGFDRTDVDEIKLVVADIDKAPQGTANFDSLTLHTDDPPPDLDGRATVLTNFDDQNPVNNHLGGAWGETNSSDDMDRIDLTFDTVNGRGGSPAALRVAFHNLDEGFCGFWNSCLGRADFPEFSLDLSRWDYLRFYVRGSGATEKTFNVKVEVKQQPAGEDPFDYTAYQYIQIDDSNIDWQPVVLSLDLDSPLAWSHNRYYPDKAYIKEITFVIENYFNPAQGTFYVDDIELIDLDEEEQPLLPSASDTEFLDYLLETNFNYFRYAVHPGTGLVLDRLSSSDLASTAATGFGLSAWAAAPYAGLLTRDEAYGRIHRALTTLATAPMGLTTNGPPPQQGQIGVNGFFYHFLDSRTGLRKVAVVDDAFQEGSELSPVDTAICLYGVMACERAVKVANGYSAEQQQSVRALAQTIIARVDWPFMMNPFTDPVQLYNAWKPEQTDAYVAQHHSGIGYVASEDNGGRTAYHTWDYATDEVLLMVLAGLAAPEPEKRLPLAMMQSWQRTEGNFSGAALIQSWPGSSFTYEFANLWLPLSLLPPDIAGTSYWQNNRAAMQADLAFCTTPTVRNTFATFDGISFGITACEDPSRRYSAFGSPPSGDCDGLTGDDAVACFLVDLPGPDRVNGTLAPYGAAAAIDFLPEDTTAALRHYYFDLALWNNLFGFPDAFNLDVSQLLAQEQELQNAGFTEIRAQLANHNGPWFNTAQFGIDQGPIVMALINRRHAGILQKLTSFYPHMTRAISKAFPGETDIDEDGMRDDRELLIAFADENDELTGIEDVTPEQDFDGDGLANGDEIGRGTNPTAEDSDQDGMPDGWEVGAELQPTVDDADEDPDKDAITNLQEYTNGTDPKRYVIVLKAGWNLVAITRQPDDNTASALFGDAVVWEWDPVHKCYRRAARVLPLHGYWVFTLEPREVEINSPPRRDRRQ